MRVIEQKSQREWKERSGMEGKETPICEHVAAERSLVISHELGAKLFVKHGTIIPFIYCQPRSAVSPNATQTKRIQVITTVKQDE